MLSALTPAATLPTTDMGRAEKFYEDTLGLTKETGREDPGGVFYKCGGGQLFVYQSQFAGTNKATAVTFMTEDDKQFDSTVDSLRKKGVHFMTFEYEGMSWDNDVATATTDGGRSMRAVWFSDPDGNIINVGVTH